MLVRRFSEGSSRVSPVLERCWRELTRSAILLLGLSLPSTAVPAYHDLLPEAVERAVGFMPAGTAALPHVAHSLAAGDPLRIVAFGSSSTEGIGASSPAAAYPARLAAALKQAQPQSADRITVINRGIGGEAVDDMLGRLDRDVIAPRPDLVIWQTGSNDPLRGVSLDHFRAATIAAVQRIREAGVDVVLMEPQWCPKLDATPGAYRFRDAVREIGTALGLPVIRRSEMMQAWIAEGTLTHEQLFAPDGLHMADRGYDLLGQAAAAEILRAAGPAQFAKVASLGE
ncbi:SGNH/GDSL hydrolase family protein [Methylobacterium sp. CM6257]